MAYPSVWKRPLNFEKDLKKRLEVAEIPNTRRILNKSSTARKTNEEVVEMAGYRRSQLEIIRVQQQIFLRTSTNPRSQEQRKTAHQIYG